MAPKNSDRAFILAPAPTWNKRITQAREAKGMSKRKLAIDVEVTPPTVTDWESGEIKSIDAEHLLGVAKVLDVSPEWILFGKPTPADLGMLDTSGMSPQERRLFDAFQGLTVAQQEDAINKMESTRQLNARQFAELSRISDRLLPGKGNQTDLFSQRS